MRVTYDRQVVRDVRTTAHGITEQDLEFWLIPRSGNAHVRVTERRVLDGAGRVVHVLSKVVSRVSNFSDGRLG